MIPRDKFDVGAIEKLKQVHPEEVVLLLPQLLEWLQDFNWPVAEPMLEVLLQYPTELTPHIEQVLVGDDDMWIFWCLTKIVPVLPFYSKMVLADSVQKLAEQEKTQWNEDVIEAAQQALVSFEPI
ncbi:MAG: DUF5071 domain-containing protein [Solibacillus sp.]|uniref:DUF5071 domain-containing protein n=1 Tax=unclassified Solibacillus TaxID=2637870 RepID=UPI0030F783DF